MLVSNLTLEISSYSNFIQSFIFEMFHTKTLDICTLKLQRHKRIVKDNYWGYYYKLGVLEFSWYRVQSWWQPDVIKTKSIRKLPQGSSHGTVSSRVSVQGVKSLGGHCACLCRGFEFYEVKKKNCYYFSKRKWKYFYTFYHFYSEKSSKRAK